MPELSNIQTYEKIEGSDFRPTLDRFCKVLKSIGIWNGEIEKAFSGFEWNVEEGFVYFSKEEPGYFTTHLSGIKIRPHIIAYTPAIDQTFQENWISCELLIEAEELRNKKDGQFNCNLFDGIKSLSFEIHKEFKQTGIYFTDEAQDGSDFDGIRSNDPKKLWQFDYAIIPMALENIYLTKPSTHRIIQQENYFEAWHRERWK